MAAIKIRKVEYVCGVCGSNQILERQWYNPNTGEVQGWDEDEKCYCTNCQKMVYWKEIVTWR